MRKLLFFGRATISGVAEAEATIASPDYLCGHKVLIAPAITDWLADREANIGFKASTSPRDIAQKGDMRLIINFYAGRLEF